MAGRRDKTGARQRRVEGIRKSQGTAAVRNQSGQRRLGRQRAHKEKHPKTRLQS